MTAGGERFLTGRSGGPGLQAGQSRAEHSGQETAFTLWGCSDFSQDWPRVQQPSASTADVNGSHSLASHVLRLLREYYGSIQDAELGLLTLFIVGFTSIYHEKQTKNPTNL